MDGDTLDKDGGIDGGLMIGGDEGMGADIPVNCGIPVTTEKMGVVGVGDTSRVIANTSVTVISGVGARDGSREGAGVAAAS